MDSPSLYLHEPEGDVLTEDLERATHDRLSLLKTIERRRANGESENKMTDWILTEAASMRIAGANADADVCGHFFLRRALCSLPDAVEWFVRNETTLFRVRVYALPIETRVELGATLLSSCGVKFREAALSDLDHVPASMVRGYATLTDTLALGEDEKVFEIPIGDAAGAILNGGAPTWRGFAYVRRHNLWKIVVARARFVFAEQTEQNRRVVAQQESEIEEKRAADSAAIWSDTDLVLAMEDLRIGGMVQLVREAFRDDSFSLSDGQAAAVRRITVGDIEDLAKSTHLPLCMTNLIFKAKLPAVRLKHADRRTLGIFLREAGLDAQQAIEFWRGALHGKEDKPFDRTDEYQVRNIYGQNGKHVLDGCKSCRAIVIESGDKAGVMNFGCPFVTASEAELTGLLRRRALTAAQVTAVALARKNCQVACRLLFQYTHGMQDPDESGVGPTPIAFYNASMRRK